MTSHAKRVNVKKEQVIKNRIEKKAREKFRKRKARIRDLKDKCYVLIINVSNVMSKLSIVDNNETGPLFKLIEYTVKEFTDSDREHYE